MIAPMFSPSAATECESVRAKAKAAIGGGDSSVRLLAEIDGGVTPPGQTVATTAATAMAGETLGPR